MKLYQCEICGNLFEVIDDSNVLPYCCGETMKIVPIKEEEDTIKEKHVPVYCRKGCELKVRVGTILHPSIREHYIKWIVVETDKGLYRHNLQPEEKAEADFRIGENEKILGIYAFCNIHGLWQKKPR